MNKQIAFNNKQGNIPQSVNTANYAAVEILEQLGIYLPTQKQIDVIETLIALAVKPGLLNFESIQQHLGNQPISRNLLSRYQTALRQQA